MVYNWRDKACYGGEEGWWIVCNNLFMPGPDTKDTSEFLESSVYPKPAAHNGHYHISGNVIAGNEKVNEDNWQGVGIEGGASREDIELAAPRKMFGSDPYKAYTNVMANVGANRPADAVDRRVLAEVAGRSGSIINSQEEVGGWPKLKAKRAPKDSDGDGVPDKWEKRNGLDRKDPSDGAKITPSGYSNLELYLHSLAK